MIVIRARLRAGAGLLRRAGPASPGVCGLAIRPGSWRSLGSPTASRFTHVHRPATGSLSEDVVRRTRAGVKVAVCLSG